MDLESFQAGLGDGVASDVAASPLSADRAPRPTLISTYVSNVADDRIAAGLPGPGARVRLSIDADQAGQPRAILVSTTDGRALGYLPTMHCPTIEELLVANVDLDVRVVSSCSMPRPVVRIEIALRSRARRSPT